MVSRANCCVCGEEIVFTIGNPIELGLHMMEYHNTGSVCEYSVSKSEQRCPAKPREKEGQSPDCPGGCYFGASKSEVRNPYKSPAYEPLECPGGCHKTSSALKSEQKYSSIPAVYDTQKCPGGCRDRSELLKRKKKRFYTHGLYKTTLETWTAGCEYITCPCCNKEVKPLIRSQKNKVAFTSLGATFLLSCWPLCFLFPMMHKCSIDLYCPNCKCKLGIYNANTGTTEPYTQIPIQKNR